MEFAEIPDSTIDYIFDRFSFCLPHLEPTTIFPYMQVWDRKKERLVMCTDVKAMDLGSGDGIYRMYSFSEGFALLLDYVKREKEEKIK